MLKRHTISALKWTAGLYVPFALLAWWIGNPHGPLSGSVKVIYPFCKIFNSMRMDQINNYGHPHIMCRIHQMFKIFWCTKPAGNTKEVRNMITK